MPSALWPRRKWTRGGLLQRQARFAGRDEGKGGRAVTYRNEVVIVRNGEWIVPQDILIVLEGGGTIRETWDGRERWKNSSPFGPRRLDYAQVDPDNRWLLDTDFSNNSMRLRPRPGGTRKLALNITAWFQTFFIAGRPVRSSR